MRPGHTPRGWRAWSLYAWANHAFVTGVATVLIGPYLLSLATNAVGDHGDVFALGPVSLRASAWPSFVITASAVVQILVVPAFGAAADARARKRRLLAGACALGSLLTAALALTGDADWLAAGLVFLAANVVFGTSDVVYNAMLPELADSAGRDRLSSRGFAWGYLGGGLFLAADLVLLTAHDTFGLSRGGAVRICFLTAGIWWAAFGFLALARLRRARPDEGRAVGRAGLGVRRLLATLRTLARMPQTWRYLLAYLFFADAIVAVTGLASLYVTHELFGNDTDKAAPFLFVLILVVQFVAVAGSLAFARLAGRIGTKPTIVVTLLIWMAIIVFAYAALHSKTEAIALGIAIGLVIGGSQALARSLWAQMIPRGQEAAFFGLYQICNRGTSWMAPLVFTIVVNATGSFRQAILSIIFFFVVGTALLLFTDTGKARSEAAAVGR
jgi:UMF1 family MFS transporter